MEFKGKQRAEEYASEKSSSIVFKENHIKDYVNGYKQALEDSKAKEMLKMLQYLNRRGGLGLDIHNKIEQLIKQATYS